MQFQDIVKYNGVVGSVIHIGAYFAFRPINWGKDLLGNLDIITDKDVENPTSDEKLNWIKCEHE